MELLSVRLRIADVLPTRRRLEANAYSFHREIEGLQTLPVYERDTDFDDVLEHASRQLEFCRDRLDQFNMQMHQILAELHRCVVEVALAWPETSEVQAGCESVLRLPLPMCPPPGSDVVSQHDLANWLKVATGAAESDISSQSLNHVDNLIGSLPDVEASRLQ